MYPTQHRQGYPDLFTLWTRQQVVDQYVAEIQRTVQRLDSQFQGCVSRVDRIFAGLNSIHEHLVELKRMQTETSVPNEVSKDLEQRLRRCEAQLTAKYNAEREIDRKLLAIESDFSRLNTLVQTPVEGPRSRRGRLIPDRSLLQPRSSESITRDEFSTYQDRMERRMKGLEEQQKELLGRMEAQQVDLLSRMERVERLLASFTAQGSYTSEGVPSRQPSELIPEFNGLDSIS